MDYRLSARLAFPYLPIRQVAFWGITRGSLSFPRDRCVAPPSSFLAPNIDEHAFVASCFLSKPTQCSPRANPNAHHRTPPLPSATLVILWLCLFIQSKSLDPYDGTHTKRISMTDCGWSETLSIMSSSSWRLVLLASILVPSMSIKASRIILSRVPCR